MHPIPENIYSNYEMHENLANEKIECLENIRYEQATNNQEQPFNAYIIIVKNLSENRSWFNY